MIKVSVKCIIMAVELWLLSKCDILSFQYNNLAAAEGVPDYYCAPEFNCGYSGNIKNLLCSKQHCEPTPHCGDYFKILTLSDSEREIITRVHNEIRHDFLLVNVNPNQFINTTGSNITGTAGSLYFYPRLEKFPGKYEKSRIEYMNEISYDKELEFFAQCWANRCLDSEINATRDNCRRTMQHRDPGQTVFLYTMVTNRIESVEFSHRKFLDRAVFTWYNEIFEYSDEMFEEILDKYKYKEGTTTMNNFVQLTYPPVKFVGCGRTQFGYGDMISLAIICNYDRQPVDNEPPYKFITNDAKLCPGDYDHPNRTIVQDRLSCTDGSGAIYYPLTFVNCMYRFHAAVRERVYQFENFTDESTNYPGLCGREREPFDDNWKPPFGKQI